MAAGETGHRSNLKITLLVPVTRAIALGVPEIGDFETQSIGVSEVDCIVIGGILAMVLGYRDIQPPGTHVLGNAVDVGLGVNAKAEVVQTRSLAVEFAFTARLPDHETKMPVEILHVRISLEDESVLAKSKNLCQNNVVIALRFGQRSHRKVDMVYTDDFRLHNDKLLVKLPCKRISSAYG